MTFAVSRCIHTSLLLPFLISLTRAASGDALLDELFPSNYNYSSAFTSANLSASDTVEKVDFSVSGLNIIGKPPVAVDHEGKKAWQANYPKGAYSTVNIQEGLSFYVNGSEEFTAACAAGAKEVVVSYSLFFEKNYSFAAGGKIPGGFGGVGQLAHSCSGNRTVNRDACFSLRLMWRSEGRGELALYLPMTEQNRAAQESVPGTVRNPTDNTFSVGRGAFIFRTGQWITIHEYVKLNDPPSAHNGEVKLFVNGNLSIDLTDVALATREGATFQGLFFQTFFGGSSVAFASPRNQSFVSWIFCVWSGRGRDELRTPLSYVRHRPKILRSSTRRSHAHSSRQIMPGY